MILLLVSPVLMAQGEYESASYDLIFTKGSSHNLIQTAGQDGLLSEDFGRWLSNRVSVVKTMENIGRDLPVRSQFFFCDWSKESGFKSKQLNSAGELQPGFTYQFTECTWNEQNARCRFYQSTLQNQRWFIAQRWTAVSGRFSDWKYLWILAPCC